jgi:hypothetical protein
MPPWSLPCGKRSARQRAKAVRTAAFVFRRTRQILAGEGGEGVTGRVDLTIAYVLPNTERD